MNTKNYILAINDGHDSSIALLKNGIVLFAIEEERLINIKHYSGIPKHSLKFLFNYLPIKPEDINIITVVSLVRTYNPSDTPVPLFIKAYSKSAKLIQLKPINQITNKILRRFRKRKDLLKILEKLNLSNKLIFFCEHHLAHAASAYRNCPWSDDVKVLIFTADAAGDGLSATVSIGYNNEIKRTILDWLRHEGAILKTDLTDWLQERFLKDFGDLDTILFELVQKGIIEIISVKNERSLVIFFINDINMFRVPPFKLLKSSQESGLPSKLHKTYVIDSQDFFNNYTISELDNLKVIEYLINPQFYEILSLLRKGPIIKKKNERINVKNRDIIRTLEKSKMVKSYTDTEGNVYYALISDLYIDFHIPQYILNMIRTAHNNNLKSNEVLLKYLDFLENICYNLRKKQ